jgi:gluconokinase
MGVSGSGKSTVGEALAARLDVPFEDGDDLHPEANVAKMSRGEPLTDEDRVPWLDRVGEWLAAHESGGVIACSALKRRYRDQLRSHCPSAEFLHLAGSREVISERQEHRRGHFMPASLLDSQYAALEPLDADEAGVAVDVAGSVDEIVDSALSSLVPR